VEAGLYSLRPEHTKQKSNNISKSQTLGIYKNESSRRNHHANQRNRQK
jgi:hypothetical protein